MNIQSRCSRQIMNYINENFKEKTVYKITQKTQHSAVTVTASQFSDQMEWELTSVAAAKAST